MSPRPYQLGKRQDEIDAGRRRILDAARALLAETERYGGFTLDAVAKRADVARATVYYQFGSKTGLLEALCDDLAASGQMYRLPEAFSAADPIAGLQMLIGVFAHFWNADPAVMRRLRALAHLDPDIGAVIQVRDDRRRQAISVLVDRVLIDNAGTVGEKSREHLSKVFFCLTSFETFDNIAGYDADALDAVALVHTLADGALRAILTPAAPTDTS